MADFSRIMVETTNHKKVNVMYDFAYGDYLATTNFFDLLSELQNNLLETGEIQLPTGQVASADSPGGLIAIQLYMDTINNARQAQTGLSKLGLNVEKQLWKNI